MGEGVRARLGGLGERFADRWVPGWEGVPSGSLGGDPSTCSWSFPDAVMWELFLTISAAGQRPPGPRVDASFISCHLEEISGNKNRKGELPAAALTVGVRGGGSLGARGRGHPATAEHVALGGWLQGWVEQRCGGPQVGVK